MFGWVDRPYNVNEFVGRTVVSNVFNLEKIVFIYLKCTQVPARNVKAQCHKTELRTLLSKIKK